MAGRPKCSCLNPNAPRSGFGSLRVLPSGRHQARYTGPDGQTHKAARTFDTHGDAEAFLARVRSEISREVWRSPSTVKAVATDTLGRYAEDWLLVRDLRPRTRAHYRALLDSRVLPTLADVPITAVSPALVRSWYAGIDDGHPTIRAHAYSLLRSILTTAVGDELIAANPCHIRGAGNSKRVKKIKPATLEDLAAIVAEMPEQLRLMVLLAAWCALRFGELAELRRNDVDVKAGVLHIRRAVTWVEGHAIIGTPKSEAGVRDVAVPPHLVPVIKTHLKEHAQWGQDGLLFPSPRGNNLTSATLYESWWPARDAAGRSDLRFHDLRHTGAVLAASTGATLAELMARLGHSTPAAALVYQHAAKGRDAEIAARLSILAQGIE
jgi:integrase